ncbi:hypothetical protein GCM10007874_08680 [Labrys miyagiensis]|uniref:Uncharacterized protein n=1 Tax=Labrys miyagiensis TaxID=346912 RepID=A0ABQ6CBU0_9HYPH|nr:hypothetical protein GCM10007874_08680 [Labrys miyagiensis]
MKLIFADRERAFAFAWPDDKEADPRPDLVDDIGRLKKDGNSLLPRDTSDSCNDLGAFEAHNAPKLARCQARPLRVLKTFDVDSGTWNKHRLALAKQMVSHEERLIAAVFENGRVRKDRSDALKWEIGNSKRERSGRTG